MWRDGSIPGRTLHPASVFAVFFTFFVLFLFLGSHLLCAALCCCVGVSIGGFVCVLLATVVLCSVFVLCLTAISALMVGSLGD